MDIKMAAYLCMFLDHFAAAFLKPGAAYCCLRLAGRLAFPMFVYCAVKGVYRTSGLRRYAGRLFLAGLLSQLPYYMVFGLHRLNVLFELCGIVLVLAGIRRRSLKRLAGLVLGLLLCWCSEYGLQGLALGIALYVLWNCPKHKWMVSFFLAGCLNAGFYRVSAFAVPLVACMERRGMERKSPRWGYLVYPVHLALIGTVKRMLESF